MPVGGAVHDGMTPKRYTGQLRSGEWG